MLLAPAPLDRTFTSAGEPTAHPSPGPQLAFATTPPLCAGTHVARIGVAAFGRILCSDEAASCDETQALGPCHWYAEPSLPTLPRRLRIDIQLVPDYQQARLEGLHANIEEWEENLVPAVDVRSLQGCDPVVAPEPDLQLSLHRL